MSLEKTAPPMSSRSMSVSNSRPTDATESVRWRRDESGVPGSDSRFEISSFPARISRSSGSASLLPDATKWSSAAWSSSWSPRISKFLIAFFCRASMMPLASSAAMHRRRRTALRPPPAGRRGGGRSSRDPSLRALSRLAGWARSRMELSDDESSSSEGARSLSDLTRTRPPQVWAPPWRSRVPARGPSARDRLFFVEWVRSADAGVPFGGVCERNASSRPSSAGGGCSQSTTPRSTRLPERTSSATRLVSRSGSMVASMVWFMSRLEPMSGDSPVAPGKLPPNDVSSNDPATPPSISICTVALPTAMLMGVRPALRLPVEIAVAPRPRKRARRVAVRLRRMSRRRPRPRAVCRCYRTRVGDEQGVAEITRVPPRPVVDGGELPIVQFTGGVSIA